MIEPVIAYARYLVQHEAPLFLRQVSGSLLAGEFGARDFAVFLCGWFTIYVLSGLWSKHYLLKEHRSTCYPPSRKLHSTSCVCSGVFSTITGSYGLWIWLTQTAAATEDRIHGHDERVDRLARLMIAYFLLGLIVDHVAPPLLKRFVDGRNGGKQALNVNKAGSSEDNDGASLLSGTPSTTPGAGDEESSTSASGTDNAKGKTTQRQQGGKSSTPVRRGPAKQEAGTEGSTKVGGAATTAEPSTSAGGAVSSTSSTTSSSKKKAKPLLSDETAYLLHHLSAIMLLAVTLVPFAQYHASALILWELSGPFLVYRILALEFGWNKPQPEPAPMCCRIFPFMQLGFVVSFLFFRIVIGLPNVYYCCSDCLRMILFRHPKTFELLLQWLSWAGRLLGGGVVDVGSSSRDEETLKKMMLEYAAPSNQMPVPLFLASYTFLGNFLLCFLNVFWAWKVVSRAVKLYWGDGAGVAGKEKAA
eukprot:g13792.t1